MQRTQAQVYTVDEAAKLLGISRNTAYAAVRDGSLPVLKISARRYLVPKAKLDAMLGKAVQP